MNRRRFLTVLSATWYLSDFLLASDIPQEPFLINSGIGGNTSADLIKRIDKDCLAYQPDLTILMVGTNDMNSMKYIPIAQYEKNMRLIISKILDSGSRIILMNLLPVYEPYLFTRHKKEFYEPEGHSGRKLEMNNLLKKLAIECNLSFLDIDHIFEKVGNVGEERNSLIQNEANSGKKDGLHPTSDGYRIIAIALYQYIMQNNLPHNRVVCFGDSITAGSYPNYLKKLLNIT
ncbi:MAG: GDSL-type esterase/lipase family protein [Bacteroidales bacterium]|jgi:lysophospholipase L1-like esterase|nr:GDSL-type esterase/lipase family protein [Bacteroidales bacterium]